MTSFFVTSKAFDNQGSMARQGAGLGYCWEGKALLGIPTVARSEVHEDRGLYYRIGFYFIFNHDSRAPRRLSTAFSNDPLVAPAPKSTPLLAPSKVHPSWLMGLIAEVQ
ncbi:hypothetical protein RUND412_011042, partial [Rhizina undulata]